MLFSTDSMCESANKDECVEVLAVERRTHGSTCLQLTEEGLSLMDMQSIKGDLIIRRLAALRSEGFGILQSAIATQTV